jgi:integrase
VEFDPATGRPTRIKTDGSAQDNADALAMARVVFAQPLPPPLAAVVPQSPARVSMSLGEAIKIYTATEAPSLKPDTWDARQRALSSFVAFVKPETPVAEIARHTAAAWGHDLMADELTKRTAGNYVSHVAQLFKWLKGQGQITGENPVKGVVVVSKREKRLRQAEGHGIEAFELEDLKRLFDPANYKKLTMAHARWAPLIALYTGARVGEIAQLYLRDFIVEDGHPCIRIDADNDGQTVKTESSRRLVPLHPVLIELGLLDYVENLRRQKVKSSSRTSTSRI